MGTRARDNRAELVKDRRGEWVVKITLRDTTVIARPGQNQSVVYDRPEKVPRYLKQGVVPKLVAEARIKSLRGE